MLDRVTAVIINWRTIDLTLRCATGLLVQYPELQLILVDNGSDDKAGSAARIAALARSRPNVSTILNKRNLADTGEPLPRVGMRMTAYGQRRVFDTGSDLDGPFLQESVVRQMLTGGNVGHGPALHQVLKLCQTPYLLALDSDCIVQAGGFIERMLELFENEAVYAVGRMVFLDRRGTSLPPRKRQGDSHIHESVIMLDVEKYRTLEPYVHYGAPSLLNMPDATAAGYELVDYDIGPANTAVHHLFRGSRKLHARMPKVRTTPIMPEVLLEHLESEYIGDYFA